MNGDAQIAREWAEKALDNVFLNEVPIEGYRAAARHILATTTPPTMEDVEWDDDVHAGLCAEHEDGSVVRMICLGWASDRADHILCYLRPGAFDSLPMSSLTPLSGTRVDLTPCRPEDVPDDSPLIPEDDWRYASDATVALWHRLVPESTPDHPTELTTEEDYRSAPEGTIVAEGKGEPFVFLYDAWRRAGSGLTVDQEDMDRTRRRVLRWGWEA